jgi:hypothetical protein
MPATYTLISSNVLSSSAASVTFSAIPATYTDLVLRISGRSDAASTQDSVRIRFNGNSSSIYSRTQLFGGGTSGTQGSSNSSNIDRILAPYVDGDSATASTFGSNEIYIPSYLASQNKPVSVFGVSETNATGTYMGVSAALFSSTTAISSMVIAPENGSNWLSGSSFYLYGISNA